MNSEVLSREKHDLYGTITDKIVAAIEAGADDFVMPWHQQNIDAALPLNALTGNAYRGINMVALWASAATAGFASGYWATYRQWRQLGAQVRKAERGSLIVFYKRPEENSEPNVDEKAHVEPRRIVRASHVFNAAQVADWQPATPPRTPVPGLKHVDVFIEATKAIVKHEGDIARYRIVADQIDMPSRDAFTGAMPTGAYYAVLLHELIHWTGAPHRLTRDLGDRFGSESYAMEELVAELGAAFLCATLGVSNEPRKEHASYVSSWLKVLRHDRKAIFVAASKANQAVDYLRQLVLENIGS